MLLSPHTFSVFQWGVPATGDSSPQNPAVWVLPMGCSSPRTAPACVLYTGHVLSGTDRSMGSLQHHMFCQKTYSVILPFYPGTQILTGTSSTKEIPQGHSFFRGTYTCSVTGSFTARERISAQWISIDFMGPTCFTMLFFTGCSISDWLSFHSDRSIWELIGTGSVRPGLGCLLTKAIPAAHLTIETLPCKSNAAGICLLNQ